MFNIFTIPPYRYGPGYIMAGKKVVSKITNPSEMKNYSQSIFFDQMVHSNISGNIQLVDVTSQYLSPVPTPEILWTRTVKNEQLYSYLYVNISINVK